MTFQRTIVGLLILVIVGLAGAFYLNWKTTNQLRTMRAVPSGMWLKFGEARSPVT